MPNMARLAKILPLNSAPGNVKEVGIHSAGVVFTKIWNGNPMNPDLADFFNLLTKQP